MRELEEPDFPEGDFVAWGCVCDRGFRAAWEPCWCVWFDQRPADWPEGAEWPA